jgi:hypothetical protein
MTLATFFIFFPPKLPYFFVKPRGQRFVPLEFERILPSHEMSVMPIMAIVIPEHPPVIACAEAGVDVRRWGIVCPICVDN